MSRDNYDLQVGLCTILFMAGNYTASGDLWTLSLFTVLFGWVIYLAYRVARGAVKRRIGSFLFFGLLATLACMGYFATLYHTLLIRSDYVGLVTHSEQTLLTAGFHTGHYTLYFSVTTFLTVGYGDIHPTTPPFMFLAATEALLGYAMSVLLITAGLDRIRVQRLRESIHPARREIGGRQGR